MSLTIATVIAAGVLSARPAASTSPTNAGFLFFATDQGSAGIMYRSDGTTWSEVGRPGGAGAGSAPDSADYLTKTANGSLSAERVVTDTAEIVWDWSTAGQAKANLVNNTIPLSRIVNIAAGNVIGNSGGSSAAPSLNPASSTGFSILAASNGPAVNAILGLGTAALLNVPASGDAASGEVVKGSDTRLTNARTPSAHQSSHQSGGSDALTGNVDANARVAVRKNTTGSVSTRRRLNFIEGSNVTITVADDSGNEEVDVTIAAAASSGMPALAKYGDGMDGAFVAASATSAPDWATKSGSTFTMVRDAFLTNLSGDGIIYTNGFTIFGTGELDTTGGIIIQAEQSAAGANGNTNGTGGAVLTVSTVYSAGAPIAGSSGAAGTSNAAGSTASAGSSGYANGGVAGDGGAGGSGQSAGTAAGTARGKGTKSGWQPMNRVAGELRITGGLIAGGMGGIGGASGGGGASAAGGGGGAGGLGGYVLRICFASIKRGTGTVVGAFRARGKAGGNGGAGSAAGCGGGGAGSGGGGGWVHITHDTLNGTTFTNMIDVSGGAGGTGGAGNTTGNGGNGAGGGNGGRVTEINATTGVVVHHDGTANAGTAGTAGSGTTGGAGGAGATAQYDL